MENIIHIYMYSDFVFKLAAYILILHTDYIKMQIFQNYFLCEIKNFTANCTTLL